MCYLRDRIAKQIEDNEDDKRVIGKIVSTMKSSLNIFKRFNLLSIDVIEKEIEQKYFNDYELLWEFGLYNMLHSIPNHNTRFQMDNMCGDLFWGMRRLVNNHINVEKFNTDILKHISQFYNNIPTNFIIFSGNGDIENFQYRMLVNNRVLPKQLQEEIKLEFKTDIQNKLDKREEEIENCQEELNTLNIYDTYTLFEQNQSSDINDKIITQLKLHNNNLYTCVKHYNGENYDLKTLTRVVKFCNKIFKFNDFYDNDRICQIKISRISESFNCDFWYRLDENGDRWFARKNYDEFGFFTRIDFTMIEPPYRRVEDIRQYY